MQPFVALGVGLDPIPQKKLTAEKLAIAIKISVTDNEMRHRAAELSRKIRSKDGVKTAIQCVEGFVKLGSG